MSAEDQIRVVRDYWSQHSKEVKKILPLSSLSFVFAIMQIVFLTTSQCTILIFETMAVCVRAFQRQTEGNRVALDAIVHGIEHGHVSLEQLFHHARFTALMEEQASEMLRLKRAGARAHASGM